MKLAPSSAARIAEVVRGIVVEFMEIEVVALEEDIARIADAIARRVAEQLAAPALSAEELGVVRRMVARISELAPMGNGDEVALARILDRLLGGGK